jgi:integrase
MNTVFHGPLGQEMTSYMEFVSAAVKDTGAYLRSLADFDAFLVHEGVSDKRIDADSVSRWLDGMDVRPSTKQSKLTHIRRFCTYLRTLGIATSLPELPRKRSDFEPYVYTAEEMEGIFGVADDIAAIRPGSRLAADLPVLLRILYGCGLRLGEAVSLTWNDVDLTEGILIIREAKGDKQRKVPMGEELTRTLRLYRTAPCFGMREGGPLFMKDDGTARTGSAYRQIFDAILYDLDIKGPRSSGSYSRGPCIHSIRHAFILHSLLKAETEGRTFMESVPFLSTYVGHAGLMETDKYLKARHELYLTAHSTIQEYTKDLFPEVLCDG